MQESTIVAKSKKTITLAKHTAGLLDQLKKLKCILCKETIDYNLLEFAIFVHDLGKVSPTFQLSVENCDYSPKVPFPDVPHSLFSLLWINKQELSKELSNEHDLKILLSAVAFHHWRDNFHNIILGNDHDFIRAVTQVMEDKKIRDELLKNLKDHFNSNDFINYLDILGFDEDMAQTICSGNDLFSHIVPPYYSYFLPQRTNIDENYKKKWIFTAGLLIRIDHFTSFIQEEGIDEDIEKPFSNFKCVAEKIKSEISKKLNQDTKEAVNIWQINKCQEIRDKNVILIAPTGSGKTEFAFLWGSGSKLFFTLPLRTAVNSIFNRAEKIFEKDNVGLLHSDADVYLYESSPNHEKERFRVLDFARLLSLPVLVSTGDQVFPSALRYPGYEKIYATLGYSKLIIDEVQAYDPRAVAIVVKLIEDIVKLGGKFLLMTATLPSFVKEAIKDRIWTENFQLIDKYEDCDNICKHKIEILQDDISNAIDKILDKAKNKKRVLVILNTVEKAQEVYKKIKEKNQDKYLKLIHSRFTFNDRKSLEDEIVGTKDKPGNFANPKPSDKEEGKILVATQVVEASLDIDADVLYTEIAPIDALVQRMGRVLRRYFYLGNRKVLNKSDGSQIELSNNRNLKLFGDEPNVFLLFFKKGYESGNGRVYSRELIEKSYELLKGLNNSNFELSEYRKYELVNQLYDNLKKDSPYMKDFYKTLEILDAGYMSEKKHEALRIFREIYTAPAIPENKIDEFKKSMEVFVKTNSLNYTKFKIDVLSKHIVNIDIRKYLHDGRLNLKNASYLVNELNGVCDEQSLKLKRWLSDIYVFDGQYNSELGVIFANDRN